MIKAERFDLLLMDMRMPGIDGAKTTEFIRNEMGISDSVLPVICMTAALLDDDIRKYREAGMNAFLRKPFSESTLLSAILSVTGHGQAMAAEAAAPEVQAPATSRDRIDLGNLHRLSGGDEQFVKEMLVTFIASSEKGLEEMLESIKSGDKEKISDLAHKLLPPCRHLGAADLTAILTDIEKSGRTGGDIRHIERLVGEFLNAFQEIRTEIETSLSKIR
jgi:CheY-like chemotaxis protein/HPt (histidine-containing phosphotransfer) domain-containing protein